METYLHCFSVERLYSSKPVFRYPISIKQVLGVEKGMFLEGLKEHQRKHANDILSFFFFIHLYPGPFLNNVSCFS